MIVENVETKSLILPSGEVAVLDAMDWEREFCVELPSGFYRFRPCDMHWYAVPSRWTVYVHASFRPEAGKRQKNISLHRLLMEARKGEVIDHENGNGLRNVRTNLRRCTHSLNGKNKRPMNGRILPKGVSVHIRRNKFQATIGFDNKKIHIGMFDCPKEAARAYDAKARELYGEFARLNFPDE